MWTRIPPTFSSSKEWRHFNVFSQKTSLAAVGYAFGSLRHQTRPSDSSQLDSTANSRLSLRLLCCGCVLHSPSNCQDRFRSAWEDLNRTGQLYYRKKTPHNKSWNKKKKKHSIQPANQQTATRAGGSRSTTVCPLCPVWSSVSAWTRAPTGLRGPQVGPSGADWFLGGWCGSHMVALVQGHRGCCRWLVLC